MLARNIGFGLASSAWAAVLGFAVVPVYLRFLGIEAYGLIGFFATLQAVFSLLDMGLAPTVNREVARHGAHGRPAGAAPLVQSLARVYGLIALALGLGLALAAPLVARNWLNVQQLSASTVQQAVMLLGLVIAARWPNALYLNVLVGAQRIELSSTVTAATATLSSVGAVLVLWLVSPTLQAFFAWQFVASLVGLLAMRHVAWRVLGGRPAGAAWDVARLKSVWRFSAGMSAIAVVAIIFTQLDKVLLSRLLPLSEFGRYMLASTVCSALYLFVSPVYNAVFPRFSALIARDDAGGLVSSYRLATRVMTALVFPLAGLLCLFPYELVATWTGSTDVARGAAPMVSLMALGCALHSVMFVPYALQIAHGRTRLALQISVLLLVVFGPLIAWLALAHGAIGGALAWLLLHISYVGLGTWLTHRHLLPGLAWRWLAADVALPLAVCAIVLGIARWLAGELTSAPLSRLMVGIVGVAVAAAACLAFSPTLRGAAAARLSPTRIAAPRESA